MEIEEEVTVKDIVNFYIKINDASKAKKEIAQLSSKDKAGAFEIIAASNATKDFRVEVARYFIYDLDARVRRKAEHFMEDLVPGWVTDPAESILKLLKSADGKGPAGRNSAVKFLFGIVDSSSLRETFMTLLNSRNRSLMMEIITILEDYIDCSRDEQEQVRIFDACLEIVVSDDADNNIKHHASNLLSVFFKKVSSTELGATLKRKYIERQVEKAEAVYRYLCSGASGLNSTFLADLLRPLNDGGSVYQIKILTYFRMILEKARIPEEADTVLDTYPDYWNQDEPPKDEKVRTICSRILRAVDELWEMTADEEVRALIIRIRFGEYANKRELLEQIRSKAEGERLSSAAQEKLSLMLQCFLHPEQEDVLKLQASQLLLFKIGDPASRLSALRYLASYLENKNLNYAEKGSIVTVVDELLAEKKLGGPVREKAQYLLFIADPERLKGEDDLKSVLAYLRGIAEGEGFASENARQRVLQSLTAVIAMANINEKLKKAAQYLEFKIRNPKDSPTWEALT
ncbi:MAG: hypothetical protein A2X82_00170 [Geobacteraceae bacterium GWC2_55_20]|nr:MAG: hypothetical protein A2X82_00170 [Geobacteraceae bacterium GWC2_55_20]OGU23074.1 MAG: hypothetical protein A2X85_14355 [Geobacteraceae bacterium GWF2_54_21]HBA72716.1 hypothetical protein [Geobacter sp.]HCE67729.1 hypothetical protein [Geobacter sp.]